MKKNMGTTDKIIRIAAAVVVGILYFMNIVSGIVAIVLAAVAGVFILTSLVGICPLYSIFGIRTCPMEKAE